MNVLECSYDFTQLTGSDGRPMSSPKVSVINILLESTSNTDLVAWMIQPDIVKDGTIVFYNRDSVSSNKTLTFHDALCVSYHEEFRAHDNTPMKTRIGISARAIDINDVSFENAWDVFL